MLRFLVSLSLVVLIQYIDVPFEKLRPPGQGCDTHPKIVCLEGCYQTFYPDP